MQIMLWKIIFFLKLKTNTGTKSHVHDYLRNSIMQHTNMYFKVNCFVYNFIYR